MTQGSAIRSTPQSIHIVGGPGSGKTTLAHQFARRLNAPCVELDAVCYEDGAGSERALGLRLADVHQIAVQPTWVTEGIYLGWTAELFATADQIVWLDLPWRIVGWRIFMRHVKAELRGNNRHSGWLKLYRFMKWSRVYYSSQAETEEIESRVGTERYLQKFEDKLVHFHQPAEIREILNWLPIKG
jgi:adenylate kinase family enzyme